MKFLLKYGDIVTHADNQFEQIEMETDGEADFTAFRVGSPSVIRRAIVGLAKAHSSVPCDEIAARAEELDLADVAAFYTLESVGMLTEGILNKHGMSEAHIKMTKKGFLISDNASDHDLHVMVG